MGNITSASETINPANPDRRYAYDALYRLTGVETGSTPPSPLEAYTYNKTGDRLSAALNGATPTAYTYAPGTHHLASVGGAARTYDANGNTTSGIGAATFVYSDANRMASMTDGPIISASYDLNGLGERVRKASTISGPLVLQTYTYDESGQLLCEYSGSGVAQAEYIYLDSMPIAVLKGGSLAYLETDQLGTPRKGIAVATNALVWQWDPLGDAFGNSPPNQDPGGSGTNYQLNFRFPGQYNDVESNVSYNYFRDYDPALGRYSESDHLGLSGGLSTYQYVLSRPLAYVDRNGEISIPWAIAGACVTGCAADVATNYSKCALPKLYGGASFSECDTDCRPSLCEFANQCAQGCLIGGIIGGVSAVVLEASMQAAYGTLAGAAGSSVATNFFKHLLKPDLCSLLYGLGPVGTPPEQ